MLVATLLAVLSNIPIPAFGLNAGATYKGVWSILSMYLLVGLTACVAYFIRWPEKLPFRGKAAEDQA